MLHRLSPWTLCLLLLGCWPSATPYLSDDRLPQGTVGVAYSTVISARGGTGALSYDVLEGELPPGLSLAGRGDLTGTPEAAGEFRFQVGVRDRQGATDRAGFTLTIVDVDVFAVDDLTLDDAYTDTTLSRSLEAQGGTPPLRWAVTEGSLPAGVTLSDAGLLSGVPSKAGAHTFTVTVADAAERTASRALTLSVFKPPALLTSSLPPGTVGAAYVKDLEVAGGKPPLSLSMTGTLPGGLQWSGTGVEGTPSSAASASLTFELVDANDRSTSATLSLQIHDRLVLATTEVPTAYRGEGYEAVFAAAGGTPPYVFSLSTGTLPPGVALSSDGTLSGTPTATGEYLIAVTVVDARDGSDTASATLKVRAPVTIAATTLADAYRETTFTQALSASGGEGALTWSVVSDSVPAGLTLSTAGVLSGTVASAASTGSFTVRATDLNARFAEQSLSLPVYSLPQLTTTSLNPAERGMAFDQTLSATGGKAPLTFSLLSGALPQGLTLDSSGRLAGTPSEAGASSFTVRVSDANGRTDELALTLTVILPVETVQFEVASWNIEWFGQAGAGPENDDLQRQKAAEIIASAGIPVWGLVEMVDPIHFANLLDSLPSYDGFLANSPSVWDGATFKNAQKLGFLYDTSRVAVESASLILRDHEVAFAGRPPLRVDTLVDLDGEAVELIFIVVHLKAFADLDGYTKRLNASIALKDYLDTFLPVERVLVIGDWNDDVDVSITKESGIYLPTPFENFVTDTADYRFLTSALSDAGMTSTVSHDEMIDHHLATNELAEWHVGTPQVLRPDQWDPPVTEYKKTTSDHYPVVSRFQPHF